MLERQPEPLFDIIGGAIRDGLDGCLGFDQRVSERRKRPQDLTVASMNDSGGRRRSLQSVSKKEDNFLGRLATDSRDHIKRLGRMLRDLAGLAKRVRRLEGEPNDGGR